MPEACQENILLFTCFFRSFGVMYAEVYIVRSIVDSEEVKQAWQRWKRLLVMSIGLTNN